MQLKRKSDSFNRCSKKIATSRTPCCLVRFRNELDELRAALSLIEGVLPGLGKEVARYRATAIAEAVEQVRPGYERVALRIAAA